MISDKDGNRSNPYRPDPAKCCEACIFSGCDHAEWCPLASAQAERSESD
jgi:hypothetical protein